MEAMQRGGALTKCVSVARRSRPLLEARRSHVVGSGVGEVDGTLTRSGDTNGKGGEIDDDGVVVLTTRHVRKVSLMHRACGQRQGWRS